MLAEFGFSLIYEDWDPGYYRFRDDGNLIFQDKPDASALATCFSTPCFPEVGSAQHMAQLSPAMGGDPWYSQVPIRDGRLGMLYGAKADGENNNYTHRWAYQSAVSYVTGSHSFKFGMNFSKGQNRHTSNSNGKHRAALRRRREPARPAHPGLAAHLRHALVQLRSSQRNREHDGRHHAGELRPARHP